MSDATVASPGSASAPEPGEVIFPLFNFDMLERALRDCHAYCEGIKAGSHAQRDRLIGAAHVCEELKADSERIILKAIKQLEEQK